MCGIAGVASVRQPLDVACINRMTKRLKHRGPDDEGFLAVNTLEEPVRVAALRGCDSAVKNLPRIEDWRESNNLLLGHRRLAILDLSTAGHQPMRYDDTWIVFNGEVYNYVELRQELSFLGYRFSTATDTEVILAAYREWGDQCVTRFNGDWAFCVFDPTKRRLFLSRDRYGIKPLFYFHDPQGTLAFASEIHALFALDFVPRSIDQQTASRYLVAFESDGTERTFFDRIWQLKPGHNLAFDLKTGESHTAGYYRITPENDIGKYDPKRARCFVGNIRDLLFDSVRLRLRSDVPVGSCLSGGLDSSSVVAVMSRLSSAPTHTFTVTFPGTSIDESHYAQRVIDHVGAVPHFVYPSKTNYMSQVDSLLSHQQEPFPGMSIYAQWEVMREVSKHVKVVLDGQAGDEVLAGYRNYRVSFLASLLRKKRLRMFLAEFVSTMLHAGGLRLALADVKALPFFLLSPSLKRWVYRYIHRGHIRYAQTELGNTNIDAILDGIDRTYSCDLSEMLVSWLTTDILPRLLRQEDRNSMAQSIEARLPFTDYRLVDYAFSIPSAYKIRRGWTKWLLRLAVADLLPPDIVWRKTKLGFAAPRWESRHDIWARWKYRSFTPEG